MHGPSRGPVCRYPCAPPRAFRPVRAASPRGILDNRMRQAAPRKSGPAGAMPAMPDAPRDRGGPAGVAPAEPKRGAEAAV